ncbi:MAG: prolyl oligopeptidase family serine peptidase [Verrucomicrobiales bacterium]|nr:prolyl oligopeptidase family serine peptidase [Verrucomicrobiales bacterium]
MKPSFCIPSVIAALLLLALSPVQSQTPAIKGFPSAVKKITYLSSGDQSQQPALFFTPADISAKRPLLVALHTWSGDYLQGGGKTYARWCIDQNWSFIHPNFRGANWTPEAMGSDLVVADILSAVEYAKKNANIDETRIYLIGVSGGGHASLLMAGRSPKTWAGVSAWCGISDLAKWHGECKKSTQVYWKNIEKALGGDPSEDPAIKKQADDRSPLRYLHSAAGVPLDINHGIEDGRSGSVPFTHSLHAFNHCAPTNVMGAIIPTDAIEKAWQAGNADTLPDSLPLADPLYGSLPPVYRKISGNTRITLFQGGHQIIHLAALNWLAQQQKGQPSEWEIKKVIPLKTSDEETQSGK